MSNTLNNFTAMLLAPINYELYITIRLILLGLIVLSAMFLITVVLMQPGNSNGIGAISGETETFLGQNKSRTKEGILKILTIVSVCVLVALSIAFFLVEIFFPSIV